MTRGERQADTPAWKELVAPYRMPAVWRSVWQVVNTLIPYGALWYLISLTFRLWDEQRQKLVGYGHLRTVRSQPRPAARI